MDKDNPVSNVSKQLVSHYRLTTAEILYFMPDHPSFLQSYIWQEYDIAPRFPELKNFLQFWTRELDGKLHSVYMASKKIISPEEFDYWGSEITLQ